MDLLQTMKIFFMLLDRFFKLLDVLGPALAEGSLRLPIPLLAFF